MQQENFKSKTVIWPQKKNRKKSWQKLYIFNSKWIIKKKKIKKVFKNIQNISVEVLTKWALNSVKEPVKIVSFIKYWDNEFI